MVKCLKCTPPTIELDKINYLSYRNAVEKLSRAKVLTRPENLKAHWSMDEDQGFVLFDSTGNHDAILVGEVSRVPGKIGSAIQFDGESGYARSDSTALSLGIEGKNPRTISLWFWLDAYQPNEKAGLYGYGELALTDETDRFWGIRNISQNNFSSFISDHYGWNFSVSHEIELRNNWNHLAHIYDGANIFIYLNGQQIASETRSLIDTGNIEPFLMGRASSQPSTYFRGKLDDFRIYDDSLNGSEISSITTSEDLISESLNLQLKINTNGEIDELSVKGLPPGLELNPLTGEVFGLPEKIGIFDVNVTATNRAGSSKQTARLIILKSAPIIESEKPKNISSSSAKALGQIISDGGEPLQMTLFWGDNDGGKIPGNWDNNRSIEGNHSDGRVSQFIESLVGNSTSYYRWMGKKFCYR